MTDLPERAPIKKTLAGNYMILHPEFNGVRFPDVADAAFAWGRFRRRAGL